MGVSVEVPVSVITAMRKKAEERVASFQHRIGAYGHNKVEQQVVGWMGEYAVRELYRAGGVNAHQNIKNDDDPDLTIPAHTTLAGSHETRQEECKSWKSGFSWNEYGGTCTVFHAERYARKGRARVWFCEVDKPNRVVIVHGWATPAEILESDIRITSSGENHQLDVLRRVGEVMAWAEEDKDGWF